MYSKEQPQQLNEVHESVASNAPYLRMSKGHLRSLYKDLSIRREFGELGINFPDPRSRESALDIPVPALNAVGERLYGRSLRALRTNIGFEISNNLHHGFLTTYETLIGALTPSDYSNAVKREMLVGTMRNANDSLRQLRAIGTLSENLLPAHYQLPDLDVVDLRLHDLNFRAKDKGFPVDEILAGGE